MLRLRLNISFKEIGQFFHDSNTILRLNDSAYYLFGYGNIK